MGSRELRIGNLLEFEGDKCEVIEIDSNGAVVLFESGEEVWIDLFQLQQIKLTEEWLLKSGFEEIIGNVENSKCFRHPKCSLIVYFDGIRLSVKFWQGNEKKYVHQLQNFYFALTNKELEYGK